MHNHAKNTQIDMKSSPRLVNFRVELVSQFFLRISRPVNYVELMNVGSI